MTSRTVRAPYKSILWSSVIFTFFCVSPRTVSWAHSLLSTLVRTHRLLLGLIKLSKSLVFLSILCTVAKASIQNLFSGFVSVNLRTVRFLTGSTKSKKPFATSLFTTFFFLQTIPQSLFLALTKQKSFPLKALGLLNLPAWATIPLISMCNWPFSSGFSCNFPQKHFSFSSYSMVLPYIFFFHFPGFWTLHQVY